MSVKGKKTIYTVIAHDYNTPLFYSYIWVGSFFKFPKVFGTSRPVFSTVCKENQLEYCGDLSTWERAHNEMKKKVLADNNLLEKIIDKTNELGERMNLWSEKEVFKKDLTSLSNKKLLDLWYNVAEKEREVYVYGTVLPLLDFQEFSFVENNLIKFLRSKSRSDEEFNKYYSVFTEPVKKSFAQDQEEDLLRLMSVFYSDKKWREDVGKKDIFQIQKSQPIFYAKLKKHTAKYSWVYYVYMGPAFIEKDFLGFIKDYLEKGVNPNKKLREIEKKDRKIKKLKADYIKQLNPDSFNKKIINLTGKFVWAKPRRKDYQSKTYYHFEKLFREIARRLFVSLDQVRSIPPEDLEKYLLKGIEVDLKKVNSAFLFHACVPEKNGSVKVLYGKMAKEFSKKIIRTENNIRKSPDEIKGDKACGGKAKGEVKVINLPQDMIKMNRGDILVSAATTPSIVAAMKKAGAIITDEGGLTCHAAIVSREMETPCIVGTKIATKVLKDGMMVEVNADKGIVKTIK